MSPPAHTDRAAPSSMGSSARTSRLRSGPSGRVVPGADGVDDALQAGYDYLQSRPHSRVLIVTGMTP